MLTEWQMFIHFFSDLDNCFDKISQVLKPKQSHCCFVVANRTVRREKIPTDVICVELAKKIWIQACRYNLQNYCKQGNVIKKCPRKHC